MEKKVVSIGEILWDVFGSVKKAGGSSMNVALHLHKQGIDSKFISAVGNDENGEELFEFLADNKFKSDLIQKNELPTSTVLVKLDKRHQATYEIVQPVAWDYIALTEEAQKEVAEADAFVYCSLTCRDDKSKTTILELLKSAKFKVFDINLRPPHFSLDTLKLLLSQADVLKINDDELIYLKTELQLKAESLEDVVKEIASLFSIQTVCLTLGDKGASVYHEGKFYNHNGYQIEVADTVGAGDSFLATFVASYLNGYSMAETLDRACKVGSFVASQPGANPKYGTEVFD